VPRRLRCARAASAGAGAPRAALRSSIPPRHAPIARPGCAEVAILSYSSGLGLVDPCDVLRTFHDPLMVDAPRLRSPEVPRARPIAPPGFLPARRAHTTTNSPTIEHSGPGRAGRHSSEDTDLLSLGYLAFDSW